MTPEQRAFLNQMSSMKKLRDAAQDLRNNSKTERPVVFDNSDQEHQERLLFLKRMEKMKKLIDAAQDLRNNAKI